MYPSCVRPLHCPSANVILATPLLERRSIWDARDSTTDFCYSGCMIEGCDSTVMPCCVHQMQCPNLEQILQTERSQRWDQWEFQPTQPIVGQQATMVEESAMTTQSDGLCLSGCRMANCTGEAFPCCVKPLPYNGRHPVPPFYRNGCYMCGG